MLHFLAWTGMTALGLLALMIVSVLIGMCVGMSIAYRDAQIPTEVEGGEQ